MKKNFIFSLLFLVAITIKAQTSLSKYPILQEIAPGYNIGNSLDAYTYGASYSSETCWGNPAITEDLVKALKSEGFKSIRIPVTYQTRMSEDGTIMPSWLDRIQEVVNYVINNGMYCFIDIHHDTGDNVNHSWIKTSYWNFKQNRDKVKYIIQQIANRFQQYDNHLILEGFNEMRDSANTVGSQESYISMNEWNQLFVDVIRATGGNNASRYLLINTANAQYDNSVLSAFRMPYDIIDNRILVGVHMYVYTMKDGLPDITNDVSRVGSWSSTYPFVAGEWGIARNVSYWYELNFAQYDSEFCKNCAKYHIAPIYWDDGSSSGYELIDRTTNTWIHKDEVDSMVVNTIF